MKTHRRLFAGFTALALLAGTGNARAEIAPSPASGSFVAARLRGDIWVDGSLDEAAWDLARPFDDFADNLSATGEPAPERTEVRVLYDEHTLYVGVRCFDSDSPNADDRRASDSVQVYVDSLHDHRTALMFQITAAGARTNGTVYNDDFAVADWDTRWEGAAARFPGGWSAELAIPLVLLRRSVASVQQWGFGVQRRVGRTDAWFSSARPGAGGRGIVSWLGHIDGIEGIEPGSSFTFELSPYVAGRMTARRHGAPEWAPGSSTSARPIDAGIEMKARLGDTFHLTAAVNPDFGEVEPDLLSLNLTPFETYFAEKRPFFKEGLELFRPLGTTPSQVPQQLFYSRRIGLDAPVLGAAKLVGSAPGWEAGLLDAVVARADSADEARGPAALPWQPQLTPSVADPLAASVSRNYFAAKARARVAEGLAAGVEVSSALPLVRRQCELSAEDPAWQQRPPECAAVGGNAVSAHFNSRSKDGQWYAYGQAAASQSGGGPTVRILSDGTRLERGDVGTGAYLRAGYTGEPWRTDLYWSWASPRLDLNALGFQRSQNVQEAQGYLRYVRPSGGGPFSEYTLWAMARGAWTADGSALDLGHAVKVSANGALAELGLSVGCLATWESNRYDTRQVQRYTPGQALVGAGTPMQRPGWGGGDCWVYSDQNRALAIGGNVVAHRTQSSAPLSAFWRRAAEVYVKARPHPRLETQVVLTFDHKVMANRFIPDTLPADGANWYFSQFAAPSLSVTLQQRVALTPRLSVQLYSQLFTYYGEHVRFFTAPQGQDTIHISDLRPIARSDLPTGIQADLRGAALMAHGVLRWEYQPGATLLLVYARNQTRDLSGLDLAGSSLDRLMPEALGQGPTGDSLLIKWSYSIGP